MNNRNYQDEIIKLVNSSISHPDADDFIIRDLSLFANSFTLSRQELTKYHIFLRVFAFVQKHIERFNEMNTLRKEFIWSLLSLTFSELEHDLLPRIDWSITSKKRERFISKTFDDDLLMALFEKIREMLSEEYGILLRKYELISRRIACFVLLAGREGHPMLSQLPLDVYKIIFSHVFKLDDIIPEDDSRNIKVNQICTFFGETRKKILEQRNNHKNHLIP